MKVLTILGTRPEIIKLSRTMSLLDRFVNHVVVHTGQNYDYELNQVFFEDLGLREPDHFLDVAEEKLGTTIANIIKKSDKIFDIEKPDALLVLGDTNSCLSTIMAKRKKIPIFHMEAGNRCFDMRVPEEINRRIADHTSDINLTYSDIARECLIREGISSDQIIKTGSPLFEVLNNYQDKINDSKILQKLKIKPNEYFVVSAHREENIDNDSNFINLIKILNKVAVRYKKPIIFSAHPRTKKRIKKDKIKFESNIKLINPLSYTDYIKLQTHSIAVLSDSGTISEESSILGFPALNIRETQERHEAFEEGAVMMVGLSVERVLQGLVVLKNNSSKISKVKDYIVPNVSEKILRIIISYTDYIKRVIWKQY